jgi:hypothetical protein
MAISDIFKSFSQGAAPAAAAPTPTNPGNIPTNTPNTGEAGTGTAPNGVVPPGTAAATEPQAPMDKFEKLWENDPNAKTTPENLFNVDPTKLMEAAGKVDFAKVIKPETLAAIQAGGEGGVKAFAEAMNSVSQTVFAQSAMATTKIVEEAVRKSETRFAEQIPGILKKQNLSESLRNDNPVFSHPAAAPILGAIQSQLATKHPTATVEELKAMSKDFLVAFATEVNPQKKAEDPATKGETDWSTFLE